jgi:hypothetical protein
LWKGLIGLEICGDGLLYALAILKRFLIALAQIDQLTPYQEERWREERKLFRD